jgi:hypothetical protein
MQGFGMLNKGCILISKHRTQDFNSLYLTQQGDRENKIILFPESYFISKIDLRN